MFDVAKVIFRRNFLKTLSFLIISGFISFLGGENRFLVSVVLFLLLFFLFFDADRLKLAVILVYLILFGLFIWFSENLDFPIPRENLIFAFPFFVIVSSVYFAIGERYTISLSGAICVLLLLLFDLDILYFKLAFLWFISIFPVIRLLSRVRRRISLFKVAGIYSVFGTLLALFLTLSYSLAFSFFFSSILSPFISLTILYFFERFLGVLTPFYLFDLQDLEHPLLVRLRKRAAGTFHHSLVIADIAYIAAKEVGANAELVRCAALYHDIGKMIRPEYFIENIGTMDRHLKISPPLSSKLVIKHVEDGVRLAKSFSLPERIIDFIREHHGTTSPEYFIKAIQKMNIEFDAKYPGPRPRSIETTIMMICDSCEAAVRSLEEYTVDKISDMVDRIVEHKLEQGQFDESPCTLSQLTKIKESIKKALIEFYHLRISYSDDSIESYVRAMKQNNAGEDRKT